MSGQYSYPLDESYLAQIHTPEGVRTLIEKSSLMELIRDLERDGYDVSCCAAELAAMVNYISGTEVRLNDILTHLEYCAENLRKRTR